MAVETEPQVECESDGVLSEREVVDIVDVSRDIRCFPDGFPVMLTLHLDVEMGPRADEGPDVVMAGWNMKIDDTGVLQNAQLPTDVCLVMLEDSATEPMSLPVVVIRKRRLMFDGSPLRWWSLQVYKMAVLRDGSILNLTFGWWMRLYLIRRCLRSFLCGVRLGRRSCRLSLRCFLLLF